MTTLALLEYLVLAACGFGFMRDKKILLAIILAIPAAMWFLFSTQTFLIITTILLGIVLAQPLYVLLGAITLVCFEFMSDVPVEDYGIFPEKIFELTDKNVLLAIPFFVVSGNLMTHGGIAQKLVDFAKALTAWLPGGLAIASIGGCVLFAAISGSSPVTVIAIGGMMFPALVKAGFGEKDSMGLLTSAGSLGIVIPPSIPMIIYAIVVSGRQVVDVGDLFLAGIGPGMLIGGCLSAYVIWKGLKTSKTRDEDLRRMGKGFAIALSPLVFGFILSYIIGPWAHIIGICILFLMGIVLAWDAFLKGFWALMLPVLILGGIYTGFFTPTEAAAVSVVYALIVELFIYGDLSISELPNLIVDATVMIGSLIVIMVIAFVFNDFLVDAQVPDMAVAWLKELELNRVTFLIAINIFLLILGCFMDIISAIMIVAPLIAPMAMAPGIEIDPVHLGIIFIVNLEIGYLTPPLGLNLFVASSLFKRPLGTVIRSVIPYTAMMLAGIVIITYVPAISLGLGEWMRSITNPPAAQSQQIDSSSQPTKVLSIEELMQQVDEDEDEDEDEDMDDMD